MDTQDLLNEIKVRFSHNSSKTYLKNKYQTKLIIADQGGLWKASTELLAFLCSSKDDYVILQDSYDNPLMVHRITLYENLHKVYSDTMFEWYNELKELENAK